jgi:hypothetical protein
MKRSTFYLLSGLGILLSCFAPGGLAQSIKPGTEIKVRLLENLNTGETIEGQTFSATLAEPVHLENGKVLDRGTQMNGLVSEAVSSGRLKRPASITLVLTGYGKTLIRTEAFQIDCNSHLLRNTAQIGGSAATGTAYLTGKQEIVLPPETELTFVASDRTAGATPTPEPVVERDAVRTPDPRPALWRKDSVEDRDSAYDALIFSERDKWLIHNYFQSNYGNLPPGLAKRGGDLPPELEKYLRREGTLPASLQKLMEPLPSELERQLPNLPMGYSRVAFSGRVLILAGDGEIVDLMLSYR